MDQLYPHATYRPLAADDPEPNITPRILIFHTMVGYLRGTDSTFRDAGYTGTESTFGVGGPADGADLDGAVWQWQVLGKEADAQYAGNAYATSVETSDGGNPMTPWSPRQLDTLVALAAWWCQQTGAPPQLVTLPSEAGFGYHEQFPEWNLNRHACPGQVREQQLRAIVIPRVQAALGARPAPAPQPSPAPQPAPAPAPSPTWELTAVHNVDLRNADHTYVRGQGVRPLQRLLGFQGTNVDGIGGPATKSALDAAQTRHGLDVDSIAGPATFTALIEET